MKMNPKQGECHLTMEQRILKISDQWIKLQSRLDEPSRARDVKLVQPFLSGPSQKQVMMINYLTMEIRMMRSMKQLVRQVKSFH